MKCGRKPTSMAVKSSTDASDPTLYGIRRGSIQLISCSRKVGVGDCRRAAASIIKASFIAGSSDIGGAGRASWRRLFLMVRNSTSSARHTGQESICVSSAVRNVDESSSSTYCDNDLFVSWQLISDISDLRLPIE